MLVITGTQRSGTSAVAKIFRHAGYNIGSGWWDDEAQGGLENPVVCEFFREVLHDETFPFNDFPFQKYNSVAWEMELATQFAALHTRYKVIKFSYLCMNPLFVHLWDYHRLHNMTDSFLVLHRDTTDVVDSKARVSGRFDLDSTLLKQTAAAMRWNFETSVELLLKYGYRVSVLEFETLMTEFTLDRHLSYLEPSLKVSESDWTSVIDTELVHF